MKKNLFLLMFFLVFLGGGFFLFLRYESRNSHGEKKEEMVFSIKQGEGIEKIAFALQESGFISNRWYFLYHMRAGGMWEKVLPGDYHLSGQMTIPEIALIISGAVNNSKEKEFVKVTFPEGWNNRKMAERLTAKGFDGQAFLELSQKTEEFKNEFDFLNQKEVKTLEGYLFPDTYLFSKEATPKGIILKMLGNFRNKLDEETRLEIINQKKTVAEIITMASIIEGEVRTEEDRKIVSGIFWNRISDGQPLQSCATLAYILGVNKKQYSFADTRTPSPYNTYLNAGLPPAPINNPGISAILAAVYPEKVQYNYFLSDTETGKTVFSKTLDEHNFNKVKHGL